MIYGMYLIKANFSCFVDKKVILYRIGDHIDISRGPMISNTDLLGRCTITAVC